MFHRCDWCPRRPLHSYFGCLCHSFHRPCLNNSHLQVQGSQAWFSMDMCKVCIPILPITDPENASLIPLRKCKNLDTLPISAVARDFVNKIKSLSSNHWKKWHKFCDPLGEVTQAECIYRDQIDDQMLRWPDGRPDDRCDQIAPGWPDWWPN